VRTKIRPTIYNFPLSGREGEGKPSNTAATKYCMEIVAKAHNPNIKIKGSKSKQIFLLVFRTIFLLIEKYIKTVTSSLCEISTDQLGNSAVA
jgi:hypothetical protein